MPTLNRFESPAIEALDSQGEPRPITGNETFNRFCWCREKPYRQFFANSTPRDQSYKPSSFQTSHRSFCTTLRYLAFGYFTPHMDDRYIDKSKAVSASTFVSACQIACKACLAFGCVDFGRHFRIFIVLCIQQRCWRVSG